MLLLFLDVGAWVVFIERRDRRRKPGKVDKEKRIKTEQAETM